MAQNDEDAEPEETPAGSSKLPIVIAAVVALLVGAGAGFGASLALAGGDSPPAGEVATGQDSPPENPEDLLPVVVTLEDFVINLRGAGGGRILRMEMQVQVKAMHQAAIDEQKPQLRDAVLTLVSDYTYADVEGLDGKTRLRDELHGRLNGLLADTAKIDRVYFTKFVVQ